MANDITNQPGGANLPISPEFINKLLGGIRVSRAQTPLASGTPLLRFLKDGRWVYGMDDTEVEPGAILAVHPMFVQHGYVCWERNPDPKAAAKLLDEKMTPIFEPKPAALPPVGPFNSEYKEQRTAAMAITNGEDRGVAVLFKTSSYGGLRCMDDFLAELEKQLATDPSKPVALVTLLKGGYDHQKHGWINTPHWKVVGWRAVDDDSEPSQQQQPKPTVPPQAATATPAPDLRAMAEAVQPSKPAEPAPAAETLTRAAEPAAAETFRRGSPRRSRSSSAAPL